MSTIVFISIYLVCSTAGLMLLKASITGLELSSLSSYVGLLLNFRFVVGFLLYATSFLVWLVLLSKKDLSSIYPIVTGLSYLVIMLAAVFILKEDFTLGKIIGVVLIGLGVITISIQK